MQNYRDDYNCDNGCNSNDDTWQLGTHSVCPANLHPPAPAPPSPPSPPPSPAEGPSSRSVRMHMGSLLLKRSVLGRSAVCAARGPARRGDLAARRQQDKMARVPLRAQPQRGGGNHTVTRQGQSEEAGIGGCARAAVALGIS